MSPELAAFTKAVLTGACLSSSVSDNTLRDISGVGIAIRGGPGTQVSQNTIVARDRDMLVGISVVAHPVFSKRPVQAGGVVIQSVVFRFPPPPLPFLTIPLVLSVRTRSTPPRP